MPDSSDAREETLAKMAKSRAEIRRLLEPPPRPGDADYHEEAAGTAGGFPRSRTRRLLLSGRGIGTVGAVVGGLLMARPALAVRLLRLIPTGAVARLMLVKAVSALRAKKE